MTGEDEMVLAEAARRTGAAIGKLKWVPPHGDVEWAELQLIEPPRRNPGVTGLHLDRAVRVLQRLVDHTELDPIPAVRLEGQPYTFRPVDGFHRFWIAMSLGIWKLPLAIRNPIGPDEVAPR